MSYDNIRYSVKYYEDDNLLIKTCFHKKINIVVPLAGLGTRFLINPRDKTPKLLINLINRPLIAWVLNNIKIDGNYVFIIRQQQCSDFKLDTLLKCMIPDCKIIITEKVTQGPACSILLAEDFIDNRFPLLIANDNQWLDWNPADFVLDFLLKDVNSIVKVSTFLSNGNHKYNYVKIDENGNVIFIKQNSPISCFATTGIYLWRRGEDYVRCVHNMIKSNKRTRGEFCIAPVINELIDEINLTKSKQVITKQECEHFMVMEDLNDVAEFEHYWYNKMAI